jgi:hypothetical protein
MSRNCGEGRNPNPKTFGATIFAKAFHGRRKVRQNSERLVENREQKSPILRPKARRG